MKKVIHSLIPFFEKELEIFENEQEEKYKVPVDDYNSQDKRDKIKAYFAFIERKEGRKRFLSYLKEVTDYKKDE